MNTRLWVSVLIIVSLALIVVGLILITGDSAASSNPWSEAPMHDYLFKETS